MKPKSTNKLLEQIGTCGKPGLNGSKMIKHTKELEPKEQEWLDKAVVNIMLGNNLTDQDHVISIKKLCSIFMGEESQKRLAEILASPNEKESSQLTAIDVTDTLHLGLMLDVLAASVFAYGNKWNQEIGRYYEAGKKLGVDIKTLTQRLSLQTEH